MKTLHCIKRFLASEEGTTDFEKVVLVGCTVILCMSIQINAHRYGQATEAPARSGFPIKVAIVAADVAVPLLAARFARGGRHKA